MQIDRYSSDPDDPKRHERSAKGMVVTLLFLFLIGLFVIWRIEGDRLDRIQAAIIGTFVPVIESGQQPGEFFAGITAAITRFTRYSQAYESLELVQNNLAEWQKRAQALELENAALKKIVNFIEVHKTAVLTVPVIADTSSPFTNSLLVNAGSENGVQVGWMATDGVGVVGHVTSVGPVISR
ncbi:MAG: rod shape-determining protein MreC, partial [Rhodobacteraceae bacterium]|nr:rod shape-determining protein MreC [Paracoccaceae bacterium]